MEETNKRGREEDILGYLIPPDDLPKDLEEVPPDHLIPLVDVGEVQDAKLELLDRVIRGFIDAILNNQIKFAALIVATFIAMFEKGSKAPTHRRKHQEIWEKAGKMLEEIDQDVPISVKKLLELFREAVGYANETHNYLFKRRVKQLFEVVKRD